MKVALALEGLKLDALLQKLQEIEGHRPEGVDPEGEPQNILVFPDGKEFSFSDYLAHPFMSLSYQKNTPTT